MNNGFDYCELTGSEQDWKIKVECIWFGELPVRMIQIQTTEIDQSWLLSISQALEAGR